MRTLALLVLVAMASPARADDREDARREFTAGQAADKQQDYQTAIEHYLRANDLVPHPFALFNIATDYEKLGQLREAATWYQRYLDAAPSSPDHAKVAQQLAELKARPAKLTVRATLESAKITLDGTPIGVTPYAGVARGGNHHLVVEKDGARDERDLTIDFGESVDVTASLQVPSPYVAPTEGATGTMYITSMPNGGAIRIDGQPAGFTPAKVTVGAGTHIIVVDAIGYTASSQPASVMPGQFTRVDAVLTRSLGGLPAGTKPNYGYLVGITGGADLKGGGGLVEFEFGGRISQYEFVIRAGSAAGQTAVDLLFLWSVINARITPVLGGGYSYVSGGFGYEAIAGLRLDLTRGGGVSILGEVALRYASGQDSSGNPASTTLIPFAVSLEAMYR